MLGNGSSQYNGACRSLVAVFVQANEDGSTLIVANSHAGKLFTVDPLTGNATVIDLGGAVVTADGLVRSFLGG